MAKLTQMDSPFENLCSYEAHYNTYTREGILEHHWPQTRHSTIVYYEVVWCENSLELINWQEWLEKPNQ